MTFKLHRRTFLRGLGGAAIGLPALECMLNTNGTAYAQTQGGIPLRYVMVFAGQSIGGDNYAKDRQKIAGRNGGNNFTEDGHFIADADFGTGYRITTPLEPLAALQNDYSMVSNMSIPFDANNADASAVPPGGAFRDFHGGGKSPLLCGTRSTTPSFRCQSITSDQVVAGLHNGFDSLVLRAQPSWYLAGSSYSGRQYVSYRGANDRIEAQASPQVAFQSLFSGFVPDGDEAAARHDFLQRSRLSVLDLVTSKRQAILQKVGAADRIRLERHFDELRDLELRVQNVPPPAAGQCIVPPDPGMDPAIGGNNAGSGSGTIDTNTGYSNEDLRAQLMVDMIHMALVCDLRRVATLQITVFQTHMNVFPITEAMGIPILADLHEVGHNGDENNRGQLAVSTCLKWQMTHYARLLDKLKATPEGDGNVLDNSVVLFVPEGGHGRQLNDGSTANQTHSVENMVMLVGGRAGGLAPGQHIDGGGRHPAQCLVSAMQAAGHEGNSLGEVSGNISELFG